MQQLECWGYRECVNPACFAGSTPPFTADAVSPPIPSYHPPTFHQPPVLRTSPPPMWHPCSDGGAGRDW